MRIEEIFYVNEYEVCRCYGGPEEGGWWYNAGDFIQTRAMFTREDEAQEYAEACRLHAGEQPDLYSVNTDYVVRFCVEESPGQSWPQESPHYE